MNTKIAVRYLDLTSFSVILLVGVGFCVVFSETRTFA